MIVTTKVKMDIVRKEILPRIDAVQGDANTRTLELLLYAQGKIWTVPEGVTVGLRYRKSDGTGGIYDTLPDGTPAWQIHGNAVTVILVPQLLSTAGEVHVQAELLSGRDALATFALVLDVAENVAAGVIRSESYVNMRAWLLDGLDDALEKAAEDGAFTPEIGLGTVTTLPPGSAASASLQGTAKAPVLNLGIPAGSTPRKGVDYWTEADQAAIDADVSAKVASALADRTQLTPEFANSIEECTDTSKLYVLPDGFIYAYIGVTTVKKFTNQLDTAGYQSGSRLSSGGEESAYNGSYLTGYIPAKAGSVIRLKNVTFQTGVTTGLTSSNQRLAYYYDNNGNKTFISLNNATEVVTYYDDTIVDDNGVITQFTIKSSVSDVEYFRLNCSYIGDDSIITVNEEMVESTETTYQWANTGRAFVPADYEERIIDLETQAVALETKVDAIAVGENGVPLYISEEAERVANLVQGKRTVGSLTFTAMSDPHVAVGTTANWLAPNETSVRDAGFALSELRKHLTLDFTAMLGDYTYGSASYTVERLKKDIQYFKKCMSDGSNGIPSLWLTGNHDINYGADSDRRMTDDELYAYITGNNVGTVQDVENVGRNYGYIDFENQRIRCIYLNSVDALDYPDNSGTADDALEITAVQTQWIADVGLDLSKKQSPEDWQIVILSHQPLNLYSHVMAVLEAHKNGASGSVDVTTNGVTATVNYDFTAAARGEVIANIHGHNHNFTAKKIGTDGWLWRICVPNMDVTRNNEAATSSDTSWAQSFGEFDRAGEPVYYPKTQGTATSTSFCVMTIDRKNRKIYAICYGAGIDRELNY